MHAPPLELLDEIDTAAAIAEAMAADGYELDFTAGPDGRVTVVLRRLDGTPVRDVAPSEALDIMCGWSSASSPSRWSPPLPRSAGAS